MKKLTLILFAVSLNLTLYSCTPQAINDDGLLPQACCGNEGSVPPLPTPNKAGGQWFN